MFGGKCEECDLREKDKCISAPCTFLHRPESKPVHYRKSSPSCCAWTEDDDGNWHTACENMHVFFYGGPAENGYWFCPYCGRRIQQVKAEGGGE